MKLSRATQNPLLKQNWPPKLSFKLSWACAFLKSKIHCQNPNWPPKLSRPLFMKQTSVSDFLKCFVCFTLRLTPKWRANEELWEIKIGSSFCSSFVSSEMRALRLSHRKWGLFICFTWNEGITWSKLLHVIPLFQLDEGWMEELNSARTSDLLRRRPIYCLSLSWSPTCRRRRIQSIQCIAINSCIILHLGNKGVIQNPSHPLFPLIKTKAACSKCHFESNTTLVPTSIIKMKRGVKRIILRNQNALFVSFFIEWKAFVSNEGWNKQSILRNPAQVYTRGIPIDDR